MIGKMRISTVIGLAAAGVLAISSQAHAVSSLSLEWVTGTDTGGAPTSLSPTITVTQNEMRQAAIVATADAAGLSGIFVSVAFDTDLGNELDIGPITGAAATLPGGQEQSFTVFGQVWSAGLLGFQRNQIESTGSAAGLLGSFDMTAPGSGLQSSAATLGSIFFMVNGANTQDDGVDAELLILDDGFDDIINSTGGNVSGEVVLSGMTVNAPEPGSAGLGIMTLASLAALARRRR